MGADFIYTILPLCELTAKRRKFLVKEIRKWNPNEEELFEFGGDETTVKQARRRVRELLDGYPFYDRRDVGLLHPERGGPRYLITGGMSGGDDPTDAYKMIDQLGLFCWNNLLDWAKEDIKKARKK